MKNLWFVLVALFILIVPAFGQTKRKSTRKVSPKTDSKISTHAPINEEMPHKKNERNEISQTSETPVKKNPERATINPNTSVEMPFVYEFSQPAFYVSHIRIEHDANGTGKITFEKQDLQDPVSDPIQISAKTLEKIKNLYETLNFLASSEVYQSPQRDFAHLGTMKLRRFENGRKREVEFNWTENKTAESLVNEYKKLTEQFMWIFDINVARENQPLESPKLVDKLDSLLKRDLISDPKQMLSILREVSNDERLPLIARNHTTKIVQKIEKIKE
jgi:hypothetical protein